MKKAISVSLALAAILLVASCFKGSGSSSGAQAHATAGQNTATGAILMGDFTGTNAKDTITIGVANDITTLDPQGSNTDANMMAFYLTHERLVNKDPVTGKIVPALASSWTVSDDGCTYVFEFPRGVTFTDGTPFTAADVKYTYEKGKSSSFASQKVADIKSMRVIDDTHLELTLSRANQEFLLLMAHGGMSIMSEKACKADPKNGPMMGTGLYKVETWKPGDYCSFVRYDGYHGKKAPTRRIVFKLFKEASTRLIALETGEIDVCIDPSTNDLEKLATNPKLDLIETPNVVLLYMPMQMEKRGLDNVHVRRALAYATDKESIVAAAFNGKANIHNNFINRGQFGLDENIATYDFSIDKAKAELAQSGFKPGELTFKIMVDKEFKKTAALIIQAACQEVGINIVLEELETAALKGKLNDKSLDYELALYQFTDDLGTDYTLRNQHGSTMKDGKLQKNGSNRCNMKDAKFNQMIDNALVETNEATRLNEYHQIENYLYDVCPIVPLCTSYINIGVKKGLCGVVWQPDAKHDYRYIGLAD